MSVLLTPTTCAIVQGGTGRIGSKQTEWMLEAGTRLVAGVTPGKGGTTLHGLPVFDSVEEAVHETQADATVLFVPAPYVRGAALEAIAAGIRLLGVIAEHVPVHDVLEIREACQDAGAVMVGPNTPGIISPGIGKLGIMPANLFSTGCVGMISRSGTLSYEVAGILQQAKIGVSTMVGIGGDPVVGTDMIDLLPMFLSDPDTKALVVVGEIGGSQEERLAVALEECDLPVCAYIAGRTAPSGKRMGHAGALMREDQGSAEGKKETLRAAGAQVARSPSEIPRLLQTKIPSFQAQTDR
jgi:succinyl-CoA synthetase alpha subunit